MLALGIQYLNGFVAARPHPSEPVEWPPHPGRVCRTKIEDEDRPILVLQLLEGKMGGAGVLDITDEVVTHAQVLCELKPVDIRGFDRCHIEPYVDGLDWC